MANPALVPFSAVLFLSMAALFYVVSWLAATSLLRLVGARLSHDAAKLLLLTALVLPAVAALIPTTAGLMLHHDHAMSPLDPHSPSCTRIFLPLFTAEHHAAGLVLRFFGGSVLTAAWFVLTLGGYYAVRLVWNSVELHRRLLPCSSPPSSRLSLALTRVAAQMPQLPVEAFRECVMPVQCSSVVGLLRPRCVLSVELVSSASDEELEAIVAHEGSHLRAGDLPATFLVGIMTSLFHFIRPVRLLARRWREEVELACDLSATAATGEPLAMAAAILRASGIPLDGRGLTARPTMSPHFADDLACSPVKRVQRLIQQSEEMSLGHSDRFSPAAWLLTLAFSALAVLITISGPAACVAHCSLEAIASSLR